MNYIDQLNLIIKLEKDLQRDLDDYVVNISPSMIIEYYNHIL